MPLLNMMSSAVAGSCREEEAVGGRAWEGQQHPWADSRRPANRWCIAKALMLLHGVLCMASHAVSPALYSPRQPPHTWGSILSLANDAMWPQ